MAGAVAALPSGDHGDHPGRGGELGDDDAAQTAHTQLGCSKCRFSAGGCRRCRQPGFRSRAAAPVWELRQVAADLRRQHGPRAPRRARGRKPGPAHAQPQPGQPLIHHLRRQLEDSEGAPTPHKYRRGEPPPAAEACPMAAPPAAAVAAVAAATRPRQRRTSTMRAAAAEVNNVEAGAHTTPAAASAPSPEDEAMADAAEHSRRSSSNISTSGCTAMDVDDRPYAAKRPFLDMLQDSMQRRREARLAGAPPPGELLPLQAPGAKRRRAPPTPASPRCASPPPAAAASDASEGYADPRAVLWEPPVSPYGLLEEELFDDPWKLLVACMLLNKTTAAQVRKVIWQLFEMCPTPEAALGADTARIEALIQPLGLFRKRAVAIQRLSDDYLHSTWQDPRELYGIGEYAAQAYYIFCRGRWRGVRPEDKDLRRYVEWLGATGGLGSGLSRHRTQVDEAAASGGSVAAVS